MAEVNYNKLLKEIENENKRINDPLTNEEQKTVSRNRLAELNKQKDAYLSAGKPSTSNVMKPYEGTKQNILKASAAYTPNLNDKRDASLAGNPDILEAEAKRNEAKMTDARNSANNAAVEEAENNVQEAVSTKVEEPAPELTESDEEASLAQGDIEEAVVSVKESGQDVTPQSILTNVADKYGFGLLKFDENGNIIVPDIKEESQWKRADTSGKLAMVGTVLSCIVSALSGGNIPPINFNKIMGVDKQYTTYLSNVHQFNEAVSSGVKNEAENIANVDYASYMNSLPPEERSILENISSDYELTKAAADKERLQTQGQVSKELIEAQAKSAVNYLIALQDAYNKGLITDKTFKLALEKSRSDFGQWSGLWERITDRAGIEGGLTADGIPYGGARIGK